MPQPPTRDCYFCSGTGIVLSERVQSDPLIMPGRCLCTVSDAEVMHVLPTMIDEILHKSDTDAHDD